MDTMEELKELENIFSYRYTEKDVDYMENLSTPLAAPPCVDNWYVRPKRQWDRGRGNDRGRGRGRGGGRYDNYGGGGNRGYQYQDNDYHNRNNRQYDRNTQRDYHTERQNRGYNQTENYGQSRDDYQRQRDGYDRRGGEIQQHNRRGQARDRYYGDRHQPYRGRGRGEGARKWQ